MGRAGLPSDAVDRDPRSPAAVVVGQEPPAGARVPPGSPVGFRTRTDVWPNATPRRLRFGQGATTATYRVVAADPVHDPLTVTVTMPATVDLRVWLEPEAGRRLQLLDTASDPGVCRPSGGQRRCQVLFEALAAEPPGVWTVGLATVGSRAVAVRVTVTFTRI
jgi:hypothetical protein